MVQNNQAYVDLITKLVSIPSPSLHEAKASAFLAAWMQEHGLQAAVDEVGNAVGVKGAGPKEILLLGHIDTFPGEISVHQAGDLLYGRGSVDAKGPLCTFAAAAAQVKVPDGWRITVVGAVEEEVATSRGARHILSQRLPQPAATRLSPPIHCIIGEPSHWDRITLGYKGRLLMDVELTVPFSHSAGEGRLPAEQAVDLWRQVEAFCAEKSRQHEGNSPFTRLDPSLRQIASRDAGAYGLVELSFGFRLPLWISPPDLEAQLHQLIQALPGEIGTKVKFSGAEVAYKGDKANPLVRAFLAAIRANGGAPRFVSKTGTADMNVVGPPWPATPMVAYGPGDSSLDHTPNEHLDLMEYQRAIEVLKAVLVQLML